MAPAHDAQPLCVDVRQRLQVLDRAHRVVHFVAAVVDGVVVPLPVTGAAAILGADDDVAAVHRLPDEREHVNAPVAVDAAVHPDHRRMTAGPAFLQRLKQVGGNVHVADRAAIRHLREVHHATAGFGVARLRLRPLANVRFEVVVDGVVGRLIADVEPSSTFFVDLHGRAAPGRRRRCGRRLIRRGRRLPGTGVQACCDSDEKKGQHGAGHRATPVTKRQHLTLLRRGITPQFGGGLGALPGDLFSRLALQLN